MDELDLVRQGDFSRIRDWDLFGGPVPYDPENPPPNFAQEGEEAIRRMREEGTLPSWLRDVLGGDPEE